MPSFSAFILSFQVLSVLALAGHAGADRHDPPHQLLRRQAPSGFVEVPLAQLQMLQSEYTTFHGWMTNYVSTGDPKSPQVAQLNQQVQAYDGTIMPFLAKYATGMDNTTSGSAPAASSDSDCGLPTLTAAPEVSAAAATMSPQMTASASANVEASNTSVTPDVESLTAPMTDYVGPTAAPFPIPANGSSMSTNSSSTAQSKGNLAVYYGQTPATEHVTLDSLCQDPNVDIVSLAFLTDFFGPAGLPVINIGPACSGDPTLGAKALNATGLLDCPLLAKNITTCQTLGKKVMLSLGGAAGTANFTSDAQATTFASTLWNLFGGGNTTSNMRPFGNVTLDGFDLDNEDHDTSHYTTFVTALRKTYTADPSKKYHISAAPQCPRPDASIPLAAMQTMDWVFVQFYNNAQAGCDIGQPGFVDSLKAWSADLSGNSTVAGQGPKLYVGAPACKICAGKGYLEAGDMQGVIKSATAAGIGNFGGVMLWDGSEAKLNTGNGTGNGTDYLQAVKAALG